MRVGLTNLLFFSPDINMNQTKRKRSSYDLRCRAPARTEVPAPQVCQTVIIRNSDSNKETFWTCCTSCKFKFMYHRNFVNKILRCRKCSKNFTGYELDAESIPSAANIHSIKQMELSAKTNKIAGIYCSLSISYTDDIFFLVTSF